MKLIALTTALTAACIAGLLRSYKGLKRLGPTVPFEEGVVGLLRSYKGLKHFFIPYIIHVLTRLLRSYKGLKQYMPTRDGFVWKLFITFP